MYLIHCMGGHFLEQLQVVCRVAETYRPRCVMGDLHEITVGKLSLWNKDRGVGYHQRCSLHVWIQ